MRDVAEDVARRYVQRAAERDREVREVTTHALTGSVGVGGRGPRIRCAGHELQLVMDVVDDALHPRPSRSQIAEPLPSLMTELVRQAEAAGHHKAEDIVRE